MENKKSEFAWRNRKVNNKPLVVLCCVLAVAVIAVGIGIAVLLAGRPAPTDVPVQTFPGEPLRELTVNAVVEQGNQVFVETSYGTVRFPFAFSDVIRVEGENLGGAAALEFYTQLDSGRHSLFTIWFNRNDGIVLGQLMLDGTNVSVTAEISEAGANLLDSERNTFLAAQECFNDVVASLEDVPEFCPHSDQ